MIKINFHANLTKITGTLHDLHACMKICCSVLRRMRNISDKICRDSKNTHFMFSNVSWQNLIVNEKAWKSIVAPGRPHHNMAHAHRVLGNYDYKHIVRMYNIYCFTKVTMVTRKPHSVMFVPTFRALFKSRISNSSECGI